MEICVQTSDILDVFGIDEGFRMIKEAGFDSVDFNIDHTLSYGAILRGEKVDIYERGEQALLDATIPYKNAAEKYGIKFNQMHAPFPTYVKNELGNDYVMMAIKRCMKAAKLVGCHYMVVHPNFLGYDDALSPEEEHRVNIERYSEMIETARECDVIICLENMFSGHNGKIYAACCAEMAEANAYIDELNAIAGEERFGFCLDVGHALLVGKDLYNAIMTLGSRLKCLHLHDNNGQNDQHLFPYMGVLDWDRCVKGLKDVGYKGALSFETFNALRVFDKELTPDALKFLAAMGNMFRRRIEA